jgi:DNA processing protein
LRARERRDVRERANRASACNECLRRSWLFAELGAILDCNCRADARLLDMLALGDDELIAALGGRRREELRARCAAFDADGQPCASGAKTTCAHTPRYPARAREATGLAALHVRGDVERVCELSARPVVAFVGRANASDYGVAVAESLGRGLAAAGVTVASGLRGALGPAALEGALALGAPTLGAVAGGLDAGVPARRRGLARRVDERGCTVAELPCNVASRRWSVLASDRLLASLADVALVVESEPSANALAGARAARALGRRVAAVPGRICSRGARGPLALLREGARLVTCVGDVLDVLDEADARDARRAHGERSDDYAGLDALLRDVLARVGDGFDTPGTLLAERGEEHELLRALGELEMMGLLARGDGGRYVVRDPAVPEARVR